MDVDVEACSSPLSSVPSSQEDPKPSLAPLPPAVFLISLPALLIHPPNHRFHAHSLCVSLLALRYCLQIPGLSPDLECRAWTAIAEVGMIALEGGFSHDEDHMWASNLEGEVEEAHSRGLLIASKHPSLRSYRSQLTFLAAQLALWQENVKFARSLLRRLITFFIPADPPHLVYTAHLKYITSLILPSSSPSPSSLSASPGVCRPRDTRAALTAIQNMQNIAIKSNHSNVALLTRVLRLRLLMSSGQLEQVEEALSSVEEGLGIDYPTDGLQKQPNSPLKGGLRVADINLFHLPPSSSPSKLKMLNECSSPSTNINTASAPAPPSYKTFSDPFSTSMALHALIIGVIFYSYGGRAVESSDRLFHLHALLDSGVLKFPSEDSSRASGIIELPFPNQNTLPMYIQTTHPRVLYVLAFLVSAVTKKDPVGRKPKKKIFSMEGLGAWEREIKRELKIPFWASVGDVEGIDTKMAKIKGDLMCELIGVSIMRSELDAAEQTLSLLIAHLRTHGLFESFAARVTLHHAHLAHTRGDLKRAIRCYKVATHVAEQRGDDFVRQSARAGLVAVRIGILRKREAMSEVDSDAMQVDGEEDDDEFTWEDVEKMALEVAEACKGLGGTMWSVGRVIEACLTDEILKAKQDLRAALNTASAGGDNYLRALVLALIASQFLHTSADDALKMLAMCENLAAGLGAVPGGKAAKGKEKKGSDGLGNVPLRVWVGERNLELHRRTGNGSAARKQEAANAALREAIANANGTVAGGVPSLGLAC
ncbi:hypothetical protein L218DRAFT_964740 [Marasmius fiardii PR-910]|nr:hypothetical protein L218DRAFT_964740 [Marasmius fiardii PR-910]